jgi:hypothetical protein
VVSAYDGLLASIGERATEIGDRPVVTHWPHVGSAYRGLAIVGQAVFGWADDPRATDLAALHSSRARLLDLAPVRVVPGHGPAFVPDGATPR